MATGGTAGDHADMMRPDHHGADSRTARTAIVTPVGREVVLWTTAKLRAHPPAAPSARTTAESRIVATAAIAAVLRVLTMNATAIGVTTLRVAAISIVTTCAVSVGVP